MPIPTVSVQLLRVIHIRKGTVSINERIKSAIFGYNAHPELGIKGVANNKSDLYKRTFYNYTGF